MAEQDDVLHLIDDSGTVPEVSTARKWKIAVIDDDQAVHEGTRFALSDYSLNGQTLEILSAYSAAEGRTLMRQHPDIAAVLLDVIMETDAAGLDLVEYIRNELKNETVRIILRTGQPGQAPERRVIVQYDINDYKAKTELTADKLFTSLTAALRSYQQLERMVQTRRGLEIIIDAASTLYDFKSMQRLAEGVLTQIASLLNVDCAGILVLRDGGMVGDDFSVLAGSGCYSRFIGSTGSRSLDPDFASAYAMAAWCYFWRKVNGWMTDAPREIAEGARLARRAVELGRDDAVALTRGGHALAHLGGGGLDGGIALLDRAVMLNPNLAAGWFLGGYLRVWNGEHDSAIEHFTRAMRLSPLDPETYRMQAGMAMAHMLSRRFDVASSLADQSSRDLPSFLMVVAVAAASHALAGRPNQGRSAMDRLRQLDPSLRISNLKDWLPIQRAEDLAIFADGLRKAGLPE